MGRGDTTINRPQSSVGSSPSDATLILASSPSHAISLLEMSAHRPPATTPNQANRTGLAHLLTTPTPSNPSSGAHMLATRHPATSPMSNHVAQPVNPTLGRSQGVIRSIATNRQGMSFHHVYPCQPPCAFNWQITLNCFNQVGSAYECLQPSATRFRLHRYC